MSSEERSKNMTRIHLSLKYRINSGAKHFLIDTWDIVSPRRGQELFRRQLFRQTTILSYSYMKKKLNLAGYYIRYWMVVVFDWFCPVMESYSKSYAFKVHRLIEACIKDLQWNYYFSVEWTKEGRILTLKTSRKSKYTFLICTILELILILPDLVLTPVLIKDNSEDISLILIPGLKWMSLWISVVLYQIPVYLYRHELAQFLNIFLKLDLSELAKGISI